MLRLPRRYLDLGLLSLFVVAAVTIPGSMTVLAATPALDALEADAAASLQAEYDILIGKPEPARTLLPRVTDFGVAQSPAQRAQSVLHRRTFNADHGLTFTNAVVALRNTTLDLAANQARLHAVEDITLEFVSSHYAHDPARDRTTSLIGHTFVYKFDGARWSLASDELDLFPMSKHGGPRPPYPPAQAEPRSATTRSGGPQAAPLMDGVYDRSAAQNYIRQYAQNYNPAYRSFEGGGSGGDCTNFVSQVMWAGGWVERTGWYLDWNYWWYDFFNPIQTRTWTYTNAFQYFFANSGRGQFLSYLVDLSIGDVIQIDFDSDGEIDHGMVVDDKVSSTLDGVFVSHHTYPAYHRPLSEVLAGHPIPPASYWAEHVIGTSP